MSQQPGNDQTPAIVVALLIVLGIIYVIVKNFSDMLGLPIAVGGEVMVGGIAAVVVAAGAAWMLANMAFHRHWLPISSLVLAAGISVALWPALDIWAAANPVLALIDDGSRGNELLLWGSGGARAVYFVSPLAVAAWLFFKRAY